MASEPNPGPPTGPRPGDPRYPQGEFLSMEERVVVAPSWGRLHELRTAGQAVRRGSPIGRFVEGDMETLLVAPQRGVFLGWLVLDGERVSPGTPLARIRVSEERRLPRA